MKRAILYAALCLSGTALAQDTTYFKQDFEDLIEPSFRGILSAIASLRF